MICLDSAPSLLLSSCNVVDVQHKKLPPETEGDSSSDRFASDDGRFVTANIIQLSSMNCNLCSY